MIEKNPNLRMVPLLGLEPRLITGLGDQGIIQLCDRDFDGGAEEDRTPDLGIANATLSQLSYSPTLLVGQIVPKQD